MTDWAIYLVAISQIIVLYWLSTASNIRFINNTLLSKNPQWVAEHPAIKQRYAAQKLQAMAFYIVGVAALAGLGYLALTASINAAIGVSVGSLFLWLAMLIAYAYNEYQHTWKAIPAPAKRSASLERRALRDFVPPVLTYACYGLYAVGIAIYLTAMLRDLVPVHVFVGRMIGVAVVLVVGSMTLLYCVWRKKQPIDDEWPNYRKLEVRGNVALLYCLFPILIWRMLEDLFSISLFNDATLFAAMSALMQILLLVFLRNPAVQRVAAR
jgi:hypothetical protein